MRGGEMMRGAVTGRLEETARPVPVLGRHEVTARPVKDRKGEVRAHYTHRSRSEMFSKVGRPIIKPKRFRDG